jgi:hypothetical protein
MTDRAVLYVVSPDGEVEDEIQNLDQARVRIQQLRDELTAKERMIRSQAHTIGEMSRDRDAEAERHRYWPAAVKLFAEWAEITGHTKAQWTADRFRESERFIRLYGEEVVRVAIHGIHHDHYVSQRRNGTSRHHDGWQVLFRDTARFEEAVAAAPVQMLRALLDAGELDKLPTAREVAERVAGQEFDKRATAGDQRTLDIGA